MTPFLALVILVTVDVAVMLLLVFWGLRGELVFRNRLIIIRAISRYRLANPDKANKYEVDYTDMRGRRGIYFRFWDHGYKHILPRRKYAIIEPYINEEDGYIIEPFEEEEGEEYGI